MSEPYFEELYKSTHCIAYCSDCSMSMVSLPDDTGFVDCAICCNKLENNQTLIDVWQDPKYTTASC